MTPVSKIIILPPYPNPVDQGPVNFKIQTPGLAKVQWSVFTSSFRKIIGGEISVNGTGLIQWDLRDRSGSKVADGLYYVRIEVDGNGYLSKVWKVLVLK